MSDRALSLLVHGSAKSGKTTLAMTAPAPRLLFDVEKASRFLRNYRKVKWNPMDGSAPPAYDGTWDTCVVIVNDFEEVAKAHEWLKSGQHPFKSVILDSISELQNKCMEGIVGRKQAKTQDWGTLLQRMGGFARDLRDLTTNPVNPIEAVVITSMSVDENDLIKPYLQGGLKAQIPYLYDITGYLFVQQVYSEATNEYVDVRRLLTQKHENYEAGERVQGMLPKYVDYPNIEQMLETIFGPTEEAQAAPAPAGT
jgi:hypothetical protein